MEGLHYKRIQERENLAELAMELRYTLNSKKIKRSVLSKDKDRRKVKSVFNKEQAVSTNHTSNFRDKIAELNKHFMQR